ncbi:Nickel and cobalt resistance protein CnrA [Stieleria neptunia]|uniref:Nickel and cobalt resistance protein CnrA n=1 Tax=Stieleria neptunia TaxID=2527979 RepID=A0A518HX10_9BACT|nr:efflux RND transporter permease subunit [Stieleria neptunia]QDV45304.1 Nickel and cobalt resistance protein CnrA [Stieleria neptunia]
MGMIFFRNGYLLWISVVVVLVAGLSALNALPRLEDPRLTNRNPLVIARFPGASPQRVESLVTERIEESLQEVPEIKKLESNSRAGIATIAIELVDRIDADNNSKVFSKIRDKLSDTPLPAGALRPVLDDQRGAVAFTLITALVWDAQAPPQLGILKRRAEELADRLRTLPGTEIVRLYGDPDEEITVDVDINELAALGFSAAEVAQTLASADSKQPAGLLRSDHRNLSLEVSGAFDSVARIESIPLAEGERGSVVRLSDVAQVERGWQQPPREIALADGDRAVFVAARMVPGTRVDRWNDQASEIIDGYRRQLGSGLALKTVFNQSVYTAERLRGLAVNLLAGAGVIMIVILVFMGWRSSLIVGSALPLVTGATLFLLLLTGGSLHQMSIFGMIIALGLLIDNAIVIVDEIRKARERGLSSRDAVRDALRHLFAPLLASTLTTVFAFAPIVLLPGNIGDFVGAIGVSVILAIVCSFVIALTLIAALAGRYGDFDQRRPRSDCRSPTVWHAGGVRWSSATLVYRRTLTVAMRFPVPAIIVAIAPALLGFGLAGQLGNQFFPRVDRNMFRAQVWLPPESSLENTHRVAMEIDAALRRYVAVDTVDWLVGGSSPSVYYNLVMNQDGAANYAQATVTTKDAESVKPLIRSLQHELGVQFPAAQLVVTQFAQGPPVDAPVQFHLYGPSLPTLQDLGERVRLAMQEHPSVLHTRVTMPRGTPKLWMNTDENAARLAGLALADVADQLQANLEGSVGGSVLEGVEEMPVRVRYPRVRRRDVDAIRSVSLVSPSSDRWIPMSSLGRLELRPETGGIGRKDGIRCNTIRGYVTNDALPIEVTRQVLRALGETGFELPPGYRIEIGGDSEEEAGAIGNLRTYVPVLVTLTIATLILVFRSVVLAALLGTVALLSIGLGLLSTWGFGFPISFNTILGTLGLVGVALNDNIVVLAAIRANPIASRGNIDAIVDEVTASTRHILSTTLTTTGGFLPLIIAGGDFWPPLAVVIAGGVLGATLIALIYIPACYLLLQRARQALSTGR